MDFPFLVSLLASSSSLEDAAMVNPCIDALVMTLLRLGIGLCLMRAIRIGHANQCLKALSRIKSSIQDLRNTLKGAVEHLTSIAQQEIGPSEESVRKISHLSHLLKGLVPLLVHSADAAAQLLGARRHYAGVDLKRTYSNIHTLLSERLGAEDAGATETQSEDESEVDLKVEHKLEKVLLWKEHRRHFPYNPVTNTIASESTESCCVWEWKTPTLPEGTVVEFDPRFLMFEFLIGSLLRRRQVELVLEFLESEERGESRVHQMIMYVGVLLF